MSAFGGKAVIQSQRSLPAQCSTPLGALQVIKDIREFGAPDRIGSDRPEAILGSPTRRRFAPPPITLTRFVEQGSIPRATAKSKWGRWPLYDFGAPDRIAGRYATRLSSRYALLGANAALRAARFEFPEHAANKKGSYPMGMTPSY